MGKTLFWYLFRDLVRIFALAAIVIAAIMSFGGLLRPLMRFGLDPMRVGEMWLYLMPAMMTYSMPIAAVFASSMVYGRLSADNELTACRGAGLSYRSIAGPGVALGMVAAVISLLFLSFLVPYFFLQAERVVYANVAQYIASSIERSHAFRLPDKGPTIYAQRAYIPPKLASNNEQVLVLVQPAIIDFSKDASGLKVPKNFSLAEQATLYLDQTNEGDVRVSGVLQGVTSFPRVPGARTEAGVEYEQQITPISMPSPLAPKVKFMDIRGLKELAAHPDDAQRVRKALANFILLEQQQMFFARITAALAERPRRAYTFEGAERFVLTAPGATWAIVKDDLSVTAGSKPIRVIREQPDGRRRIYEARTLRITPEIEKSEDTILVTLDMGDVVVVDGEDRIEKVSEPQIFSIAMPDDMRDVRKRTSGEILTGDWRSNADKLDLMRQIMISTNEVAAEMHSRASFGVSCLVLVLVGTALGMLLRSGDFLSAFAASVIPALITITLVVAGSQMATEVSEKTLKDGLWMGLSLIWLGNGIALAVALMLFQKLRRS